MPNNQVQIRRDTESTINGVIPADGEIAYNLTKDRIHMGNGLTAGGVPHANYADIQDCYFAYIADSGSANSYVMTLPYAPQTYRAGQSFKFKASNSNTGSSTININGLGVKNIYKYVSGTLGNLTANDLIAGGIYEIVYDGTQFQLQTYANAGISTVRQGDLATSIGGVSASGGVVVLPGGEYGFSPQITTFNDSRKAMMFFATSSSSHVSSVQLGATLNTTTNFELTRANTVDPIVLGITSSDSGVGATAAYANQRYVTSSPPFDLGEGDAGGFFFAEVNHSGDIVSTYLADAPPWAYNGPTKIRADKICPITGKKYRRIMVERTIEEIMDGAKIFYQDQEITMDIKNADMAIIPHPFPNPTARNKIILIDPMDERIRSMIEYQNAGGSGDLMKAIEKGQIMCDIDKITRKGAKCPSGVELHKLKFKYSKGK